MYVRDKLLKSLKLISAIIVVATLFRLAVAVFYIAAMFVSYGTDFETIKGAVDFDVSVRTIIWAPIVLCAMWLLSHWIRESYFFNSYFEGDLSGMVSFRELSDITGDSEKRIGRKLGFYRKFFMKNFIVRRRATCNQIELNSKKIRCQCGSCGAEIEKSEIFAGNCPYCGNLDITVKVLSSDGFYTINYNNEKKYVAKDFRGKGAALKLVIHSLFLGFSLIFVTILFFMSLDLISNVNDQDYLRSVILEGRPGMGSYSLIKKSMYQQMVFNGAFLGFFLVVAYISGEKVALLALARRCANIFERSPTHFLAIDETRIRRIRRKRIKKAISFSYLKNCSFERHDDELYVALGRKIVRDKCPNCSAPISDPVYEDYRCKYCGSEIMGVVAKK